MSESENGPRSVEIEIEIWLKNDISWRPLSARLSYNESDPLAVTMNFFQRSDEEPEPDGVEWIFARSLMAEGIVGRAGAGDVVFESDGLNRATMLMMLRSPAGKATFRLPIPEVQNFLDASFAMVPVGSQNDAVEFDLEWALVLWFKDDD